VTLLTYSVERAAETRQSFPVLNGEVSTTELLIIVSVMDYQNLYLKQTEENYAIYAT